MFDIRFVAPEEVVEGRSVRRGRITLDNFAEDFESPIGYWSASRYESQWKAAAERLRDGKQTSGFMVWAVDLPHEQFGLWWPAWVEGDRIAVQNQLLFAKDFPRGFDLDLAYNSASYAEPWFDDPGERPSRWYVTPADMATYLAG